ncbi:tyrosine-type recombinase/integrase [Xanthomonas arboricola]|uniref:tyrosine-type recombinase/integrase n=1 Tax=Xanthomonas arboricola TaxID=56448 RepID=UPI000E1ECEA0
MLTSKPRIFFSAAEYRTHLTYQRGSTPEFSTAGWKKPASIPAPTAPTTMRRTNASLIYRRTRNVRAVQLLLGHTKLESTVRYLGIEVDDALEIAEQTDV